MSFKTALLAVALAASSFAASAETLSANQPVTSQASFTTAGAFTRNYFFELDFDAPALVGYAFTELKFFDMIDIDFTGDGAGIFVYETDSGFNGDSLVWSGTPTMVGGFPADAASFNTQVNSKYFQITVVGDAIGTGATKGQYNFAIVAAPVPEAQSYAMALAGLGVAGLMMRRRRQQG